MKLIILLLLLGANIEASAFDYFKQDIDYWKEGTKTEPPSKVEAKVAKKEPIKTEIQTVNDKKFDWDKYSDPKNPEFFKEGDYTPPAPFMEVARNPSNENIQRWFSLIEVKNKIMANLQKRLGEFVSKVSIPLDSEELALVSQQQARLTSKQIDFKRFRFRLYFDSSCPHCKSMLNTLKDLQDMGYYVELRQVDDRRPDYPIGFPTVRATKDELKERKINSWPVMFVADTQKELIYRIDGYFPTQGVLATLANR